MQTNADRCKTNGNQCNIHENHHIVRSCCHFRKMLSPSCFFRCFGYDLHLFLAFSCVFQDVHGCFVCFIMFCCVCLGVLVFCCCFLFGFVRFFRVGVACRLSGWLDAGWLRGRPPWGPGTGPSILDHGPWTMGPEPSRLEDGPWTMPGLWTMVHGLWSLDHGPWTMFLAP